MGNSFLHSAWTFDWRGVVTKCYIWSSNLFFNTYYFHAAWKSFKLNQNWSTTPSPSDFQCCWWFMKRMLHACPTPASVTLACLPEGFDTGNLIHRNLADSRGDQSTEVKTLQILSSCTNVFSTITWTSVLHWHSFTLLTAPLLHILDSFFLR